MEWSLGAEFWSGVLELSGVKFWSGESTCSLLMLLCYNGVESWFYFAIPRSDYTLLQYSAPKLPSKTPLTLVISKSVIMRSVLNGLHCMLNKMHSHNNKMCAHKTSLNY